MLRNSPDSRRTYQYLCLGAKSQCHSDPFSCEVIFTHFTISTETTYKPVCDRSVRRSLTAVCEKREGETRLPVALFAFGSDAQTRAKRWKL